MSFVIVPIDRTPLCLDGFPISEFHSSRLHALEDYIEQRLPTTIWKKELPGQRQGNVTDRIRNQEMTFSIQEFCPEWKVDGSHKELLYIRGRILFPRAKRNDSYVFSRCS